MKHIAIAIAMCAAASLATCAVTASRSRKSLAPVEVVVDASQRYQTIDGFGTCLISWEPAMAEWYRRQEAVRIFAEDLRFNILRCNLWGDGTIGPVDDPARISYKDPRFAKGDPRTPVFLQFAKAVQAYDPALKVIGTVWSPPAWMKENDRIEDVGSGAIDGSSYAIEVSGVKRECTNRVRKDRYPHFARWLVEMVRYYETHGVRMYAVSPANEPQFTQRFESCVWTAKDLATIMAMVGAELKRHGLGRVKVFGPETMTGFNWNGGPNYKYTRAIRDDPLAWTSLGIWATHGYADGVTGDVSSNSSAKFWSIITQDHRPYWVTEGGTGRHPSPDPVSDRGIGVAIHNALVAGNASAFVPWQYAQRGGGGEHALMPLTGLDKKTQVVRNYSRYIPAGSARVDASPAYGAVNASAFVHGNDVTIVLLNTTGEAQNVAVSLHNLPGLRRLNVVRTSASEDCRALPALGVQSGIAAVEVPGPGIVTLTTLK